MPVPAQENVGQQVRGQANSGQRITKEYIQKWGYENMKAMTDFKSKKTNEKQTKWMDDVSELSGKYADVPIDMQQLANKYTDQINE